MKIILAILIMGGLIMVSGCSSKGIGHNDKPHNTEFSSELVQSLELSSSPNEDDETSTTLENDASEELDDVLSEKDFDEETSDEVGESVKDFPTSSEDNSNQKIEDASELSSEDLPDESMPESGEKKESNLSHETSVSYEEELPDIYIALEKEFSPCRLIVNGKDISDENYVAINKTKYEAAVPLTTILKELGVDIQDVNRSTKSVVYDGKTYTLDLERCGLFNTDDVNILEYEGGRSFAYKKNGELIVTDPALTQAFWEMGLPYRYRINREQNEIIVEKWMS